MLTQSVGTVGIGPTTSYTSSKRSTAELSAHRVYCKLRVLIIQSRFNRDQED